MSATQEASQSFTRSIAVCICVFECLMSSCLASRLLCARCGIVQSNVLWHLLNGYMTRMFDPRLEEEILEAAKLVRTAAVRHEGARDLGMGKR